MLQNGNTLLEENWPSFCSSCKSDLRSFFSIGVPSYLDESVSSISSHLQDALQSQVSSRIADDESKTRQLTHEMKIRNRDKAYLLEDALSSNAQLRSPQFSLEYTNESFSSIENLTKADEENMSKNVTLKKQLNNITCKGLYGLVNLKNRTGIVNDSEKTCKRLFENLKLLRSSKFCDFNMQEARSFQTLKSAVDTQSLDRWKEIHDIILWKKNLKIRAAITSRAFVDPEATQTDLQNRRRNVYELATQVAKLSAYVRNVHKFLLKRENVDKARTHNDNSKEQKSIKNKAIESCTNRNTSQDLSMYSYNPLRTKVVSRTVSN